MTKIETYLNLKDPAMQPERFWDWLHDFLFYLDTLTHEIEMKKQEGKESDYRDMLPQLRIAERIFNDFLKIFSNVVQLQTGKPTTVYLKEKHGEKEGLKLWNIFKAKRDNVADRISTLIESDPNTLARYNDYCDALKKIRSLGSML